MEDRPHSAHTLVNFRSSPLLVAVGSGLSFPGFTLIGDEASAAELWNTIALKVQGIW
jgi:hypothetical protein